jgi:hypothetical protein
MDGRASALSVQIVKPFISLHLDRASKFQRQAETDVKPLAAERATDGHLHQEEPRNIGQRQARASESRRTAVGTIHWGVNPSLSTGFLDEHRKDLFSSNTRNPN